MNDQWGLPPGLIPQKIILLLICQDVGVKYLNLHGSLISTRSVETEKAKALTKSHEQEEERTEKIKCVIGHIHRVKPILFQWGRISWVFI